MGKKLTSNVHVDGDWYGPAYGNENVPDAVAKKIDNPAAFEETGEDNDVPAGPSDQVLAALQNEAKAKGVKVDKRWGADRLREEIAGAAGAVSPEPAPTPEPKKT